MSKYGFSAGEQYYKFKLITLLSNPANSQNDVWLADDITTDLPVALKIMDSTNVGLPATLFEARLGARLKHPNLCEVVMADVFSRTVSSLHGPITNQFVAIGFAFEPLGTCTTLLQPSGILPVSTVHKLLLDTLAGLEYLHEMGWLHNDLKPANILRGPHGSFRLSDYGISWNPAMGKPTASCYLPHAPPESLVHQPTGYSQRHVPTIQTDLYQLSVAAYRLVNGVNTIRDDFSHLRAAGRENEFYEMVAKGVLPDRNSYHPSVPRELRRIINRGLSLTPADRYASALEMRRDLEKVAFSKQWTESSTGKFVCEIPGATCWIEETTVGRKTSIALVKKFSASGKEIRPSEFKKTGLTPSEAHKHKEKVMLKVLK